MEKAILRTCSQVRKTLRQQAVLKTLIYADLFDYPLKINEIHKWLIGRKVTLRQVEKILKKLNYESRIKNYGQYYFLPKRENLATQRRRKEKQSVIYFRKAKIIAQVLKLIPWIKLVGISGGLALENASKKDDIDLFIITSKNRLWISRLMCLGLLSAVGQRRKVGDKGQKVAGKICLNILLEEDRLEQKNKDIFVAHEVLQMKPLWQRDGVYTKYLEDNSWAFKFLPNWTGQYNVSSMKYKGNRKTHYTLYTILYTLVDLLENLAKKFQLKIMKEPKGLERIEEGALYFHPKDCRLDILKSYQLRVKN